MSIPVITFTSPVENWPESSDVAFSDAVVCTECGQAPRKYALDLKPTVREVWCEKCHSRVDAPAEARRVSAFVDALRN